MIASEVRNIVFTRKIEKWTKISECLAGTCTTLSHTNQADLYSMHSFLSEILEDEELIKEELEAEIEHDAAEEHQKIVRRYCHILSNLNGSSKFAK